MQIEIELNEKLDTLKMPIENRATALFFEEIEKNGQRNAYFDAKRMLSDDEREELLKWFLSKIKIT